MNHRVVYFEIHAENMQRAVTFYTALFGWRFKRWDGPINYWMIMTGDPKVPGIDGGLVERHGSSPDEDTPVSAYVCTVDVDDIDAVLARVIMEGGSVAAPKAEFPGVGFLAYCKDPEGNIFGILQPVMVSTVPVA